MTAHRATGQAGPARPIARFFNTVEPVISLFRIVGPSLVAEGYAVEIVVTGGEYRVGGETLADWARDAGVRLVAAPGVSVYPRTGLRKALVAAYYAAFAACYAIFARGAAVNVFMTQPPMFFTMGRLLQVIRRQPFVCVIMDVYPDILVAFGKLGGGGVLHRLLHRLAYGALRKADAVVSIGRCMSARLERSGVPPQSIHLVPNWAEPWLVAPDSGSARMAAVRTVLRELGLAERFVLLYSGNMGAAHTFDELLGAAERLGSDERIRFLVVGQGVRRDTFVEQVAARGLSNVTVLPYQERARAASLMSEVDAHVVTQRSGFEGLVVPSKAYSALATGKPLIYVGRTDGEIARMIAEEAVGLVIPIGAVDHLVAGVASLADNPDECQAMGRRARALATGRYGQERARAQYTAVIKGLVDARRGASSAS